MSQMSFHLAKALSAGRARRSAPLTRESILAGLLQKRAAAARCGLSDLEQQLRSQIRWSLPILTPPDSAEAGSLSFRLDGAVDGDPPD